MLPHEIQSQSDGPAQPTVFLLHWLGGSTRTWTEVSLGLAGRGLRSIAIDLPGFGDAAQVPGYTVAEMAAAVIATISALRSAQPEAPWLIAGHSMGGKVAAVVARAASDGTPGLEGLRSILLVSPSPPGPEPMPGSKRVDLLASLGRATDDAAEDRKRAATFVDDNTGKPRLKEAVRDRAIDDILRMNRSAFAAWLEHGSKEDFSAQVGVLSLPALVVAGQQDAALGPEAQQERTLPHLASAELVTLKNAGHLGPLERAAELTELMVAFIRRAGVRLPDPSATSLAPDFAALVDSPRTASQTRAVLQSRLGPDEAAGDPAAIPIAQMPALRALVETIVPGAPFDLAARVDRTLASGPGDGWRFAGLPPDADAWRLGLASLDASAYREHGSSFIALSAARRRELIEQAQQGRLSKGLLGTLHIGDAAELFDAAQMQQWSEDARALITRLYVADPRTMQRIGFTGFADGAAASGDGAGFTQIQLGQTEDFEAEEPA